MASPSPSAEPQDKGISTQATELWHLVRAYALQETVEPIKGLGKYAAFGLAGSIALSLGLVLLLLGALRALQTATGDTFEGSWSWAPYLIVLVLASIIGYIVMLGTRKKKKV
jgi:tetrahydromethanopterin S-methyltransferase subunit C